MVVAVVSTWWVVCATAVGLDDVLQSTGRHHPSILTAVVDIAAAQGEATQAAGAFDPSLKVRAAATPLSGYPSTRLDAFVDAPTPWWGSSLQAGYRLGRGSFAPYYGERETDEFGELRAQLAIPLLRNGATDRRRANIERADLGRAIAALQLDQQKLELRRQASRSWVKWVNAGERLALARGLLQLANARQAQLHVRAQSGDAAAIDVDDNQRAILQREALVVAARRGVEEAALELSLFYRDDQGQPRLPTEDDLPPALSAPVAQISTDSLDEVVARRPDVARLRQQKQQADVEVRLAQNQVLPSLDVQAAVSKDLGPPTDAKRHSTEVELGVWLEVPLLYRQPLGRLEAARAGARRVELALQLLADRVRVEVKDALSALDAAAGRAALVGKELTVTRALERAERSRFELGDSTVFFVNQRETATFEAAVREVDARADWHRASADLAAAAAVL